jgi:hypothetical protein
MVIQQNENAHHRNPHPDVPQEAQHLLFAVVNPEVDGLPNLVQFGFKVRH